MEQAPNDDKIAARVKRTMGKDRECHANNLERNEEKKKRESEMQSSSEPTAVAGDGSAGVSRAQVGGPASSSSPPAVSPLASRKREAEGRADRESPAIRPEGLRYPRQVWRCSNTFHRIH